MDNFLHKILDVIDYQGDRNAFVDKMTTVINQKALHKLISSLPEAKQQVFLQKVQGEISDPDAQHLMKSFSEEELSKAYNEARQELLVDYLKTIAPSLTDQQKNSLLSLASA